MRNNLLTARVFSMTEKNGVMICGHGSRDEDAVREFKVLSDALIKRFPDMPVE